MAVLTSTKPAISVPHIEYLYLFFRGNKKPTKSSQKVSQHPKLWRVNWWCRREFFLSLTFCFGLKMSWWKIGHDADKKDGMRLTRLLCCVAARCPKFRRCHHQYWDLKLWHWPRLTHYFKKDPIWIFSCWSKLIFLHWKTVLILQWLFE